MDLTNLLAPGEKILDRCENLVATNKRVIKVMNPNARESKFGDIPYEHLSSIGYKETSPSRWPALIGIFLLILGIILATGEDPGAQSIGMVFLLVGIVGTLAALARSGTGAIHFYAPGLDDDAREEWVTKTEKEEGLLFIETIRENAFRDSDPVKETGRNFD